ncbi:MAG TPA: DUF732 domain-containing protein [Sporichthya sp.]|nr:DUF732 domain-containing protein [Sporichthya sp.]
MSLMLEQDYTDESAHTEKESLGRTVARVLLLSLVVTALVAGLYMAFGRNEGADPLATGAKTPAAGVTTDAAKPAAVKPKPLTYEQKVAKAIAALPTGSLSTGAKRTALITYLGQVDIKVTAASSPATAASNACSYLAGGYSPSKMVTEVAAGGGYTKAQSKAFLLGASTLYCPTYAKNFR